MAGVKIFEQVLKKDNDGNIISKIAILQCDDMNINDIDNLHNSLIEYVDESSPTLFIEHTLSDPYTRVIISGIDKLNFKNKIQIDRKKKLNKINKLNGFQ